MSLPLPLPAPPALAVAPPAPAPTPASPPPAPALLVDPTGPDTDEVVVGGRRMRLVAIAQDQQLDLGGDGPWLRSPARFRVTVMPSKGAAPRVNMKGLNCFVVGAGGRARPSTAIDVEADMDVELIATDRRPLDGVRCTVGRAPDQDGRRLYDLGPVTIAVPAAAAAVMIDLGPGRELALLHRSRPAAARRGR